CQQYYSLPLAF
nr:immunoglobulin light chain junction region [Macaca mulatta]